MSERQPAEVFPPGEFIRDEIEERGWTQADLADILGRPLNLVNQIIAGKRGVTAETADGLARAFGSSASLWLNLESAYRLWQVKTGDMSVEHRALLYEKAPVRDMIRRQWIEPSNNPDVLEQQILNFFQIKSMDDEPAFWAHAARKATTYSGITPAQAAWLARGRQLASAVPAERYSSRGMSRLLGDLATLLANPMEIRHAPEMLANAGVRLLIIEPLPKTKIDGACFWLNKQSPVIVLSLRFDRIDAFWFTLMHELAHVATQDGLLDHEPLDVDLFAQHDRENRPEFEHVADQTAVEALVPQSELEGFIGRMAPLYSKARINGFANRIGVHPGLVVGQLQHREEISYAHSRDLLVRVRSIATASTLTDGWGQVLPIAAGSRGKG